MLRPVSLSTSVTDKRGETSVELFYYNAQSILKLARHSKNGGKFRNWLSKVRVDEQAARLKLQHI